MADTVEVLLPTTDVAPEQALGNIEEAQKQNLPPDTYAESKEIVDEIAREPVVNVSQPVAEVLTASEQNAHIVKHDISKLTVMGKQIKYSGLVFKGKNLNDELSTLSFRKSRGDRLTQEENADILRLTMEIGDVAEAKKAYNQHIISEFAHDVLGVTFDIFDMYRDETKLVVGGTLGLGALYAAPFLPTVVVNPVLAKGAFLLGAAKGFGISSLAGYVHYTYFHTRGSVYHDLTYGENADPNLPEANKRNIALGAGLLAGAITAALPAFAVMKNTPGLRNLINPRGHIKNLMKTPKGRELLYKLASKFRTIPGVVPVAKVAGAVVKPIGKVLGSKPVKKVVGSTGFAEALEEGSQTFIEKVSIELGKTWDGQELSLEQALDAALTEETFKEVLYTGAVGAVGGQSVQFTLNKTVGKILPKVLKTTYKKYDTEIKESAGPVRTFSKGVRALQLKAALDQTLQLSEDTNIRTMLPEQFAEVMRKFYAATGITEIYVNPKELNAWANSDERAAKVLELIGPTGLITSELSGPIRVDFHKLMILAQTDPDITNLVMAESTGPSAMTFQMEVEANQKRKNELLTNIQEDIDPENKVKPGEDPFLRLDLEKETSQLTNQINDLSKGLLKEPRLKQINKALESIPETRKAFTKDTDPKTVTQLDKDEDTLSKALAKHNADLESITTLNERIQSLTESTKALEDIELGEQRIRDEDITNEDLFHEQQTYTKVMEDTFSPKEILKLNEAEIKARVEVADAIEADKELKVIVDMEARIRERALEAQKNRLKENGPRVDILESFLDNSRVDKTGLTEKEIKSLGKRVPIHAIDPTLLSDRLKNKYEDDPVLKARKVFRKNGLSPEDVAVVYGQNSVEELLDLLANTPTRDQILQEEINAMDFDEAEESKTAADIEQSFLARAYEKAAKLHLKTGALIRSKNWAVYGKGLKKTLDLTRIQKQLNNRARNVIGNTVVNNLDIGQWTVAAKRSKSKSIDAYLGGRLEEGFRQAEKAAYALQLAKQTTTNIAKVNRAFGFISKLLHDPRYQAILNEAGPSYAGAVDYLTNVFDFDPSKKNTRADSKHYKKYLKDLKDRGAIDQSIPDAVSEWLDPKDNPTEMTVDQVLYIEGKLRTIYHHAKNKHDLKLADELRALESIENSVHIDSLTHPDYDIKKLVRPVGHPLGFAALAYRYNQALATAETSITSNQFITLRLDQGRIGGLFARLIHQPIQGTGDYEGPTGRVAKAKLAGAVSKNFVKMVKKHYDKTWGVGRASFKTNEFSKLGVTTITIPELNHVDGHEDGGFIKIELMIALANLGNPENAAYVEQTFGLDPETMRGILEKYLTKKDFDFVQEAFLDPFTPLGARLAAVHKESEGVDLDLVQPESYEAFGKTYAGGYFPVHLTRRFELSERVRNDIAKISANSMSPKPQNFYSPAYEGIVKRNHTLERVGSNNILDLSVNRFSESIDDLVHDITMREPIKQVLTLVTRDSVKNDIIAITDEITYNQLLSNLARLTHSDASTNLQLHSTMDAFLGKLYSKADSAFSINSVLFNANSLLMSSLALPQVALKMGHANFLRYGSEVALKIGGSILTLEGRAAFAATYELAASIDPSLQMYRQGVEEFTESTLSKHLPKSRIWNNKVYATVKEAQEAAVEFGFTRILGGADTIIKMYTTVAVYNMYVDGNAPGISYADVHQGKTLDQIHRDAKAYTGQLLEGTTMRAGEYDKGPLQLTLVGKLITKFYNEIRLVLNNTIGVSRKIKWNVKQAKTSIEQGNYGDANMHMSDAGSAYATLFITMMASKALINGIREGRPWETPEDELEGEEGNIGTFIGYHLTHPVSLTAEYVGSTIPIVLNMAYGRSKTKPSGIPRYSTSLPLTSMMTDVTTTSLIPGIAIQRYEDGLEFGQIWGSLKYQQKTALINTVGYGVGGVPFGKPWLKLERWLKKEGITLPELLNRVGNTVIPNNEMIDNLVKNLDEAIQGGDTSLNLDAAQLAKLVGDGVTDVDDTLTAELIKTRDLLSPVQAGDPLTLEEYEQIKRTESNGKWDAVPDKGAARGIFQFVPKTWRDVMATPEGRAAKLTKAGRTARNSKQQEIAMRILTKDNVRIMRRKGVPINLDTIYFAHHFGTARSDDIYLKPDKTKLPKNFFKPTELANNKLGSIKTVGDMKKYIKRALKRGEALD